MDRISDIFASKKPLVVFTTAGYPDPARSEEGIEAAIENGADIIELGVPFSDPMADGPVIAAASVFSRVGYPTVRYATNAPRDSAFAFAKLFLIRLFIVLPFNFGLRT